MLFLLFLPYFRAFSVKLEKGLEPSTPSLRVKLNRVRILCQLAKTAKNKAFFYPISLPMWLL
jgi:hypothetical protein